MNKRNVKGFTLIELVIVIVILGILAAVAIPRYVNLKDDALDAAKQASAGAVKAALAIAIAEKKGTYPTVDELATSYVSGQSVSSVATGVQLYIGATPYIVKTYADPNCSTATGSTGATVQCVGDI